MKVILLEDVKGLGKEGDMVDAKNGYARNFLIPRGFALEGTKENIAKWEVEQKERRARYQEDLKDAEALKTKLEKTVIKLSAKAGEGGKLFGAITTQDIKDKLSELDIDIDKKKIEGENIKTLGKSEVLVRIFPEVVAKLTVEVVEE